MKILNNLQDVLYEDTIIENESLKTNKKLIISESRQKMMKYLDVDGLVLSFIKDGIHELVKLYEKNDKVKERNHLNLLFKLCFSFLQKFVADNSLNQKRLYKNLHIFLQHLNIQLGQIQLVCEIFKNNLNLIGKVDEEFLLVFRNLITKYGRKPLFLEFLKVIQIVNGKPVPNTQRLILNMFIKEDLDYFLLYMNNHNPPEFVFQQSIGENPEYLDEPYVYHAALIEVLGKSGFGVTGMYFNEAKCQNIIKLSTIFSILFKATTFQSEFFALKLPILDFFYNIYLDCEIINPELKTCERFFDYIYLQSQVLNEVEQIDDEYLLFLNLFIKIL